MNGGIIIHNYLSNEKILIYDDNPEDCIVLKEAVEKYSSSCFIDIANTRSEMESFIKNTKYCLIFMDIELDADNGIEIISNLQQNGESAEIVYVTAHVKYCEDIFDSKPADLIIKPVSKEKIERTLSRIIKKRALNEYITIKTSKNKTETISLKNTAYIETIKRDIVFFDENSKELFSIKNRRLSLVENLLPIHFKRCHQSFYVNMNFVNSIERYFFTLKSGIVIPISQSKFKKIRTDYFEYIGGML